MIGRERGFHGCSFGGTSIGGIVSNRKMFSPLLLNGVDHLPHTYNRAHQAFNIGEPAWGAHLADELLRIIQLHDASTIAAVIVEPMSGSTGVLPAPVGYLKRLREICDQYGILLIFDEVITAFGRLGFAFAAQRYGVVPDMICFAKGVSSGTVPVGGVLVRDAIHESFMQGAEHTIEFLQGFTYSGHPLAASAILATLDVYHDEGLFERALNLEPLWAQAMMSLKGEAGIEDIRTVGLAAGFDLTPEPNIAGRRGFRAMDHAFHTESLMIRSVGDTLALCPPLIVTEDQIEQMVTKVRRTVQKVMSHTS
jgi:beta-alanine--pyruvate transaminase